MVTHQLQVERRTGKVRRPETDVLPLCHATNSGIGTERNYVTVALCIEVKYTVFEQGHGTGRQTNGLTAASLNTPTVERGGWHKKTKNTMQRSLRVREAGARYRHVALISRHAQQSSKVT